MGLESIQNYYELLVSERLYTTLGHMLDQLSDELLDDVACIALNDLPPRYVCHTVDFLSHLSPQQRERIEQAADEAILRAAELVVSRRREQGR